MRVSTMSAALVAAATVGATASAQSAAPAAVAPAAGWSVSAGYEAFEFRDISRNMRPPDASPVSWRGSGSVVTARLESARARSSHIADVTVARAGDFEYVSPTRILAAGASDTGSRLEGRYEYRRYFWRDAGIDGLDIGIGAQGIGSRVAWTRAMSAYASSATTISGGGVAGVAAVRFDRWDRLHLHAEWTNGGVISYRRSETTIDALSAQATSGGNWLTDIQAGAAWRVTQGIRLSLAWRRSAEGYSSSHFSYSSHRRSWSAGVVYAR